MTNSPKHRQAILKHQYISLNLILRSMPRCLWMHRQQKAAKVSTSILVASLWFITHQQRWWQLRLQDLMNEKKIRTWQEWIWDSVRKSIFRGSFEAKSSNMFLCSALGRWFKWEDDKHSDLCLLCTVVGWVWRKEEKKDVWNHTGEDILTWLSSFKAETALNWLGQQPGTSTCTHLNICRS